MLELRLPHVLSLAAMVLGFAASPAAAYKWPGEAPSPGGAIAAKVIAQHCANVLSPTEVSEIDAYLARADGEMTRRAQASGAANDAAQAPFQKFVVGLTETYTQPFRDGKVCSTADTEEARHMLGRVRNVMTSDQPLFPDETDPSYRPDMAAAVTARLTAENCRADLTAVDVADLDLYIAQMWSRWVKHSVEADARVTMDLYSKLERDMTAKWSAADCSVEALGKARRTLTLVRKS